MISFKIRALEEFFSLPQTSKITFFPLNDRKVFNQHVCFCEFVIHEEQKQTLVCKKLIFLFDLHLKRVIAIITASIKQIEREYKQQKSGLFLTLRELSILA